MLQYNRVIIIIKCEFSIYCEASVLILFILVSSPLKQVRRQGKVIITAAKNDSVSLSLHLHTISFMDINEMQTLKV